MKKILFIGLLLILYSCNQTSQQLNIALEKAGSNKTELEAVLEHYSNLTSDSLKLKSAQFLIEGLVDKYHTENEKAQEMAYIATKLLTSEQGLTGRRHWQIIDSLGTIYKNIWRFDKSIADIKTTTRAELIDNIDMAFYVWEHMPWAKHLSFSNFCEYILPFQCLNLTVDVSRTQLFEQYKWVLDSLPNCTDPVKACTLINDHIKAHYIFHPPEYARRFSDISLYKGGECFNASAYALLVMRSVGIPVKIMSSPLSGYPPEPHSLHVENTVLSKGLKHIPFQGSFTSPQEEKFWPDVPRAKWYCHLYLENTNQITNKQTSDSVPKELRNPHLKDITAEVAFSYDIELQLNVEELDVKTPVTAYLCVAGRRGTWTAVAAAEIKSDKVLFKAVEPGYCYFPMLYAKRNYSSLGKPFFLLKSGEQKEIASMNHQLSDSFQTLQLNRKYPLREYKLGWAASLLSGEVQVANNKFFKEASTIYTINDSSFVPCTKELKQPIATRFVRLKIKPKVREMGLAELEFWGQIGEKKQKLEGELVCLPSSHRKKQQIANAIDGNDLSYASFNDYVEDSTEFTICYDFKKKVQITQVKYLARTDKNWIVPGNMYQLDYLIGAKWKVVNTKIANDYTISFENAPVDQFYLLRNLTEGTEEYFFTYQKDRQVWW